MIQHTVQANINGVRKLISDGYNATKHDKLVELYSEVRPIWFELAKRAREAKRQRELKKAGGKARKPVGRVISNEILAQLDTIAIKYKLPNIGSGRELVEFLKQYPPAKNAAAVDTGAHKQIQRRDIGFKFENDLTKKLRHSGSYVWVGRSAGSYGAVDIVAISRRGVMLAQCKATEAERKMKSDHDKLVKLHDKLGHLAELRLYFLRDGQPVFVKLDETTLPGLVSEGDPWKVVTASVSFKLRAAAEHKQMISELSTKLHWGGSDAKLDAMYRAIVPFWKKLAEQKFQWSGESRVEFRKLLDQYRGYLVSQDAHVTKALMLPKFSPVEIESDESLFKRDSGLEQKIVKQAGFAMKVEKEHDYKTPIHVVRSTSNGSKLIVYHCNRSGFLSEEDVSWLTSIVTRLPKQVEFRVAWYENKRSIVTKTVKDEAGLRFFTTQRGID